MATIIDFVISKETMSLMYPEPRFKDIFATTALEGIVANFRLKISQSKLDKVYS